jgi:hypothetical protein
MTRADRDALIDAAHSYIAFGWPMFPVDRATKRPLIRTGRDHAEHASTVPRVVEQWVITHWPCGLGMPTGAASRTVVVDLDAKHDGEALLGELEAEAALGPLPRERVVRTRSGGLHVYCAHPGGMRVRSGAGAQSPLGRLLGGRSGVDVRADGGIVVLPPTPGYRWIADDDGPLPPTPPMWLAAIQGLGDPPPPRPPPRPIDRPPDRERLLERARKYVEKMPAAVAGDGGHAATWRVAVALVRGFALDEHDAHELLGEYSLRCDPPWSDRELLHKIMQARRADRTPIGYLLGGVR